MRDLEQLERGIEMGTPLLFVETADSAHVEGLFRRLGTRSGRPLFRWSLASGLAALDGYGTMLPPGTQPAQVLARVLAAGQPGLYLMLDLASYLDDALVISQLREIAARHADVPHALLLAGADLEVPGDLRACATTIDLARPSTDEIAAMIADEAENWGRQRGQRVQSTQAALDALARHLAGLSHADARRLTRLAIRDDGLVSEADFAALLDQKYKLLDLGGVLSFERGVTSLADVAGLANLKRWLTQRRDAFVDAKSEPGLDPPKGVLLLGVQGGGKSLAAKSIAGAWGLPLLRLDFATLYNKYYGETERNLRESLRTAAAMAPCVLWIDEIEKGLASEGDDGGPGKRLLGTLLTWMAERKDRTFLVATANDIEALPPELLRKGRFDEIFFVDLPKSDVRAEIFSIHLKKRGQDAAAFDRTALAEASDGFSGAEIEQVVVSGLYTAKEKKEPLSTQHLRDAIAATRPLSVVMAEKMLALRIWASERTVPAD